MSSTFRFQSAKWGAWGQVIVGLWLAISCLSVARAGDDSTVKPSAVTNDAAELTAKPGFDIDGDHLPAGVIARLGTKQFRSGRDKKAYEPEQLKFSADGNMLIQTIGAGWLQRWDAVSGRLLSQTRIAENASGAASSADGGSLAVGGWKTTDNPREVTNWFKLIDAATGKETLQWEVVEARSEKLALSPDGHTVAWGKDTVHVLDVASQSEVASRLSEAGGIGSLTFTPDGKTLAIGQRGKLLLWNWAGKDEPRAISIGSNPRSSSESANAVAFSPDGVQVAVGRRDSTGVTLFDLKSGQPVRSFGLPGVARWNLHAIAFSPDGNILAAPVDDNAGGGVAIWEVATGKLLRRLKGLSATNAFLAFSPDGRRLAAASSWDLTMCVWNLDTGEPFGADLPGHVKPPNSLRFIDHDRQLASAGDDGTIRIWNLADSSQQRVIQHEPDPAGKICWIRSMDVSPDGKYVASSGFDDTVRLWDLATGREVYRLPGHGRTGGHRAVQFTPDSMQFASWGDDMQVRLWDVATGKPAQEYRAQPQGVTLDANAKNGNVADPRSMMRLTGGCFSPDASTLMVVMDRIYRFSVATGEELPKIESGGGVFSIVASSPDNRYGLVTSHGQQPQILLPDGRVSSQPATTHPVELWSLEDNKILSRYESAGSFADRVAFSRDGSRVAMAVVGDRPRVEIRTVPELADAGQFDLPSRAGGVEYSASGKLLATSIADGTVLIWDLEHLPQKPNP
jgi:WD40 repeat protein